MSGDLIGFPNHLKAFQIQIVAQEKEPYRRKFKHYKGRLAAVPTNLNICLKDDPLTAQPVPTLTRDSNSQRVFDGYGKPFRINPKAERPEYAHENIVTFDLRLQANDDESYCVGEWTDEEQALAAQKELSPTLMIILFQQILEAAAYLHEGKKIAHGNIQSSNIFVAKDRASRCKLGYPPSLEKPATIDQDRRDIGKVLLEFSLLFPWSEVMKKPQVIRPHPIWVSLAELGNAMSHADYTKRQSATTGLEIIQNLAKQQQSKNIASQQCKVNLRVLQDQETIPLIISQIMEEVLPTMSIHVVKKEIIMTMSEKAADTVDGIITSDVEDLNRNVVPGSIDVKELHKTLLTKRCMKAQTSRVHLEILLEHVFSGHLGKKSDITLSPVAKKRERDGEDGMQNGAAKKRRREG